MRIYVRIHATCSPTNWVYEIAIDKRVRFTVNYLRLKVPTSRGAHENSQSPTSHLSVPRSISCASWTVKAANLFLGNTFIDDLLKSHIKAITNPGHSRAGNEHERDDKFIYSYWRTRRKCKTTFACVLLFWRAIVFPAVSIISIGMSAFRPICNTSFQRLHCRRLSGE